MRNSAGRQRILVLCLLGWVHGPDIADDVGEGRPFRIGAQQAGIDDHAQQFRRMHGDLGNLPQSRSSRTGAGERAAQPRLDQDDVDPLRRQAYEGSKAQEHTAQIACLLPDYLDAVGRDIPGERPAEAVEDLTARRDQQLLVGAVVLGQQREVGAALDLEVVQPCGQHLEERQLRPAQDQGAARETARALCSGCCTDRHQRR